MKEIREDDDGDEGGGERTSCFLTMELQLEDINELAAGRTSTFNLEKAVCNHGFFMMAPNRWDPVTKTLQRPLRLSDGTTSLLVSISHKQPTDAIGTTSNSTSIIISSSSKCNILLVRVNGRTHLDSKDQKAILDQVKRMLRISVKDERDVQEFHKLHPEAEKRVFGRLFRSPTLFEDVVKSILLCNCTWMRTLMMAQALCDLQLKLENGETSLPQLIRKSVKHLIVKKTARRKGVKRKRFSTTKEEAKSKVQPTKQTSGVHEIQKFGSNLSLAMGLHKPRPIDSPGNFPTAEELASLSEELLKERCKLGYRARTIIEFAREVHTNKLSWLKDSEQELGSDVEYKSYAQGVYEKLMKVKGFGPFACANVLMCTGFYERVPQDSETKRHLIEYHDMKNCNKETLHGIVKKVYEKYAPFQCLAYWLELVEYYERKHGSLSVLPSSSYGSVTGSK